MCPECGRGHSARSVSAAQLKWLRMARQTGSAGWVDTPDCHAPLALLREYVERRLDLPVRGLTCGRQ